MTRFRTGDIWVLIATDLMGRGMDFKGVNMVINYGNAVCGVRVAVTVAVIGGAAIHHDRA